MNTTPNLQSAYMLLHQGILAFARAEQAGMRVDVEYCKRKKAHLTRKIATLEERFHSTNFYKHWRHVYGDKTNIGSDFQLSHILYNVRKIKPIKVTAGGRGSTDEDTLMQLGIPEVTDLIQIGKLTKLRDVYLDAFIREQVDSFLHPFFNLHPVRTYRSSSDHPNFQNIPKRDKEAMQICRRAILPRLAHQLGEADYSGLEVRIAACYHKDPVMLRYINDPTTDMHSDMARQLFNLPVLDRSIPEHRTLRDATKNGFVFPQFYGSYYGNCATNLACNWGRLPRSKWRAGQGIPMPSLGVGACLADWLISTGIKNYNQFEEHVKSVEEDFWGRRFQVYQQWKDEWWAAYQKNGYFDMLTGFRCSGVMSKNDAINYPVQGAAFHCLLWSFIELDRIQREEQWDSHLIGQIHDAIVLDIAPAERDHVITTLKRVTCKDLPKAWDWIIVPLDVEVELCEVDESWDKKRPYNLAA